MALHDSQSRTPRFHVLTWPHTASSGRVRQSEEDADDANDLSQQQITEDLFDASWRDPNKFLEKIQEIHEVLGPEEANKQIKLLEDPFGSRGVKRPRVRAEASSSTPRWAFTIKPKWCQKILHEGKVWEIRGKACSKHLNERICVAESGSGTLVGEMTVRESRLISREELEANRHLHMIDDLSIVRYKKIHAWVLENVQAYREPKPYRRPTGCVDWVDLEYYDHTDKPSKPAAKKRAKKRASRAQCARAECNFGLGKLGGRGKPYTRKRDGAAFEHCLFCSQDAFLAALRDKDGQPIHRTLARLAQKDAALRDEALERIRQMQGPEAAARFAGARQKKPILSWQQCLQHRQPALRLRGQDRTKFDEEQRQAEARLKRKFPSIHGDEAREESMWMPERAAAFRKWCMEDSWRMCSECKRMVPQPFLPSHARCTAKGNPQIEACAHCKSNAVQGYWAPTPEDVPRRLRKLSPEIIEALRPFNVHTGRFFQSPSGYVVHDDMMQFSFKRVSVEDALAKLPRKQREKGEKALEYLLKPDSGSAYVEFWQLHHRFLHGRRRAIEREEIWAEAPVKRMPANFIETVGIECALWPHLYWTKEMTETHVRSQDVRRLRRHHRAIDPNNWDEDDANPDMEQGGGSRQSAKASFLAKVHSALIGYNSDSQLLQFVYDLWLFTTLGGAKNSAGTGIREALASKPYSPEAWRTYHMALVDLQKQIGWPSLFITVAPYEWSFPYHRWLEDGLLSKQSL